MHFDTSVYSQSIRQVKYFFFTEEYVRVYLCSVSLKMYPVNNEAFM